MLLLPKPGNAKTLKHTTAVIFYLALKTPTKSCTFLLSKHPQSKCVLHCISRQNTDHVRTILCKVTIQPSWWYEYKRSLSTFLSKIDSSKFRSRTDFLPRTTSTRFFWSLTIVEAFGPLLLLVLFSCITEPLVGWAVPLSRSHGFWRATAADTSAQPPTHETTLLYQSTKQPATHSEVCQSILHNHIRFGL